MTVIPGRFVPKLCAVDAVQFTGENFYECARFLGLGDLTGNDIIHATDQPVVKTPDGDFAAQVGDWIVKSGEEAGGLYHLCRPHFFMSIYDCAVEYPKLIDHSLGREFCTSLGRQKP